MKETQHVQRALELLNEPTMQFGAVHRRKRKNVRYQPYPDRSRPETYKARAYFPGLHQSSHDAMFADQPSDRLYYEIEFE